jgi:hypothetical protein
LSVGDYLHEKAEGSLHNEMSAYLVFIAGAIFFVGEVLEIVTITRSPDRLVFFPYQTASEPLGIPGLALTISGILLLAYGFEIGFHYTHDRVWYMKELYKAHSLEASSIGGKKGRRRNNVKM